MLKRILCLLVMVMLALSLLSAAAEPRYPQQTGHVTDAAAVLSATTVRDLDTLNDRLDDADAPELVVVTVDFLDGADVETYAEALFTRWRLKDAQLLLLMAVGEDQATLLPGKEASGLLSTSACGKLMTNAFSGDFLLQQYDAAISSLAIALVQELDKVCDEPIRTDDLFGASAGKKQSSWTDALRLTGLLGDGDEASFFTREDRSTGFSFLKVVLIVVVLLLVFGTRRKRNTRTSRR